VRLGIVKAGGSRERLLVCHVPNALPQEPLLGRASRPDVISPYNVSRLENVKAGDSEELLMSGVTPGQLDGLTRRMRKKTFTVYLAPFVIIDDRT